MRDSDDYYGNWEFPDVDSMLRTKNESTVSGGIAGGPGAFFQQGPHGLTEVPIFTNEGPMRLGPDQYVIDPDYYDILGLSDPMDLIKRYDR